MTSEQRNWLWLGLSIAFLMLVGALLGRALSPPRAPVEAVAMEVAPGCNAVPGPCRAHAGPLQVELSLDEDASPMTPFVTRLRVSGVDARSVADVVVAFSMVGMDMGLNRYRLKPLSGGSWKGSVTLPVCAHGRNDWVADVTLEGGGKTYVAQFPFTTR